MAKKKHSKSKANSKPANATNAGNKPELKQCTDIIENMKESENAKAIDEPTDLELEGLPVEGMVSAIPDHIREEVLQRVKQNPPSEPVRIDDSDDSNRYIEQPKKKKPWLFIIIALLIFIPIIWKLASSGKRTDEPTVRATVNMAQNNTTFAASHDEVPSDSENANESGENSQSEAVGGNKTEPVSTESTEKDNGSENPTEAAKENVGDTGETQATTKAQTTTKVPTTTKAQTTTKAPATTKAQTTTTKVPTTTKAPATTKAPTTTKATSATLPASKLNVTVDDSNVNEYYSGWNVKIKNTTSSTVNGWRVEAKVPAGAQLDVASGYGYTAKMSGNTVVITSTAEGKLGSNGELSIYISFKSGKAINCISYTVTTY